jgi:hypothetical protein
MPPVRFESTISSGERLQTYVLDREATGAGENPQVLYEKSSANVRDWCLVQCRETWIFGLLFFEETIGLLRQRSKFSDSIHCSTGREYNPAVLWTVNRHL